MSEWVSERASLVRLTQVMVTPISCSGNAYNNNKQFCSFSCTVLCFSDLLPWCCKLLTHCYIKKSQLSVAEGILDPSFEYLHPYYHHHRLPWHLHRNTFFQAIISHTVIILTCIHTSISITVTSSGILHLYTCIWYCGVIIGFFNVNLFHVYVPPISHAGLSHHISTHICLQDLTGVE